MHFLYIDSAVDNRISRLIVGYQNDKRVPCSMFHVSSSSVVAIVTCKYLIIVLYCRKSDFSSYHHDHHHEYAEL